MELLFCFVTSCKLKKKLIREKSGMEGLIAIFSGSSMGQQQCKAAELSCHRLSLLGFLNPFMLARGVPSLCFVLSKCCTDGSSLGPAQPARHNVLPEGSVFLDPPGCHHIFSCTFEYWCLNGSWPGFVFAMAVLTLRLWSSAAVLSLASKLPLSNFFLLVA